MKEIELLIESKVITSNINLLYSLLGSYGDSLPKRIEGDIRNKIKDLETRKKYLTGKVKNNL